MGRRKELTAEQRGTIFYCRQRGDSYRKIAKTVGCGLMTVCDTLKRHAETGSTESKARSGRPRLIESNACEGLKKLVMAESNRRLCLSEIQELWTKKTGKRVSAVTMRRTLHSVGLRNRVARRKPLISAANKVARLAWCRKRARWTRRMWANVLWSDECTFTQFDQSSISRVWRTPEEEYSSSCVAATVKHSPSRMFWGCFSREGVGSMVPLYESVTGSTHITRLKRYVVPTMRRRFSCGNGWFQEDNARPHKTKGAAAFHRKSRLRVLDWPAQSPDLNPIENLWAELKKSIRKRKTKPTNLTQLKRLVKVSWKAIPKSLIENLVDSMPDRIQAVIAAEGGPTRY
jgi:transposase